MVYFPVPSPLLLAQYFITVYFFHCPHFLVSSYPFIFCALALCTYVLLASPSIYSWHPSCRLAFIIFLLQTLRRLLLVIPTFGDPLPFLEARHVRAPVRHLYSRRFPCICNRGKSLTVQIGNNITRDRASIAWFRLWLQFGGPSSPESLCISPEGYSPFDGCYKECLLIDVVNPGADSSNCVFVGALHIVMQGLRKDGPYFADNPLFRVAINLYSGRRCWLLASLQQALGLPFDPCLRMPHHFHPRCPCCSRKWRKPFQLLYGL